MENIQVSETGLAIVEKHDALSINRAPDVVLDEARKAAEAIAKVIEAKPNKIVLNDKTYLQFEDWQTLGRFYGVTAIVKSTRLIELGEGDEKIRGYEATAEALLVSTNQVISSADAMCLNDEQNWGVRSTRKGAIVVPLFQLRSMAQTRACAKALRNVLAWVVVLAGYSPTPAEEMTGDEGQSVLQKPQRKSEPTSAPAPEVLNAVFEEEHTASPRDVFRKPQTMVGNCQHKNVQPAGVSKKTGKPYSAFCKDCGAHV